MPVPLTPGEIQQALTRLPGWVLERDALAKTFQFDSFRAALAFMVRAGFEAEELNHHPEWTNVYNRVSVRLNTHDAGDRVTAKDVELAQRQCVNQQGGGGHTEIIVGFAVDWPLAVETVIDKFAVPAAC